MENIMTDSDNVKRVNPLLERFNKMPPETFRLPSGGGFYKNGELDEEVVDGEVIIYPMTTQDEITMKSPDMLFQGTAIEKVFNRCMPQIKKPMDLLSNDVDFLMICLRIVTYGSSIEIKYECPKCNENNKNKLKEAEFENEVDDDFDEEFDDERNQNSVKIKNIRNNDVINVDTSIVVNLNDFIRNARGVDVTDENFTIKLDTGEVVKLTPSKFKDMIKIYQFNAEELDSPEELANWVYDAISSVIESVNGHSDKDDIREWLAACEAPIVSKLQSKITDANDWGTTYDHTFKCDECGFSDSIIVPINPIELFTTPLTQKTQV